eukprot:scaffold20382_cov67-Attheya_sp.AAC.3
MHLVNVYDTNRRLPEHIRGTYDFTLNQHLQEMSEIDRMNHVDTAFLSCRDDEEQTVLWTTMVPSLVNYESVFCSICCCRLPQFYFTKNQHRMKRTRRACRHCETNCRVKVAQINWIIIGLSYFVIPQQCAMCLDYCSISSLMATGSTRGWTTCVTIAQREVTGRCDA